MRMRQKTFLTTRGRFLVGFFVSPAVMAMDSVPPSGRGELGFKVRSGELTCEGCCYEDRGEATYTIHERCLWDVPIMGTEVLVGGIASAVDGDAKDNEDLGRVSNHTQTSHGRNTDRDSDNFEETQPIFKLPKSVSTRSKKDRISHFTVGFHRNDVRQDQEDPEN